MKYTTTIMMSVLLMGMCSARILHTNRQSEMDDNMKLRDADNSKPARNQWDEVSQNKAEDWDKQQMGQLKDTVYQKLRNAYQQLNGKPYNHYLYLFEEFPEFADPLDVGSTDDRHGTLTVHYDSVQFRGLNSSSSATLRVDADAQTATLVLSIGKAEVSGHYTASDHNSGHFSIKMAGHLTYVDKFSYVIVNSTYVALQNTSGELYYNSYESDYENGGSYSPSMQKDLQHNLLLLVSEKLRQELYAYAYTIQYLIQEPFANNEHQEDSVEKIIRKGVNNAVNGIQQAISKHGVSSIDLTSDNQEMVYNKLHAKITSLKLNGIQRFYLAGNHVSNDIADKIHAKVELALDRPTATAVLSIHEAHDEDSPFQKINVDFEMEQLIANLLLDKSTRQSGLELRSVQTKVNRIWPVGTEKFQGQVSHLIKEKLAGHMKRSIEEGLKNFLENKLSGIMRRGDLSASQEKRSTHNQW